MELYYIGLHQVQSEMQKQFSSPEERERPVAPVALPRRVTMTDRIRLAAGRALYALASAIDPATPVPSRSR